MFLMKIVLKMCVSHNFSLVLFICLWPIFSIAASQELTSPNIVLEKLTSFDSIYKAGFNAKGKRVNIPLHSGVLSPTQVEWRISRTGSQLAYQESIVKTLEWKDFYMDPSKIPPKLTPRLSTIHATPYRSTFYFGSDLSGMYCENGVLDPTYKIEEWIKDAQKPILGRALSLEKADAQAYTLFYSTALWSLGRGFSADITQIDEVREIEGGLLYIRAKAPPAGAQLRSWELIIEPNQMYVVRSAKRYRNGKLELELSNSGEHWFGQVLCPVQMQIIYYRSGTPLTTAFTVEEATFTPDLEFIQEAFTKTHPPYDAGLDVIDFRKEVETADPAASYKQITPEEARMLDSFGSLPDRGSLPENFLEVPANSQKTAVGEVTPPAPPAPPPPLTVSSKFRLAIPYVLALLAFVFLTGGGYMLYHRRR